MTLLEVSGYEFVDVLGEGAFGLVYRARQESVGRDVAIKVIRSEHADDPEFIRRFEAEAQLVAQLEHPNIVPLYDFWRDGDGAFLVMRLLDGGSVAESLEQGPWSLADSVRLVQQVGGGLAAAHRRGVIHRDVKPSNVLLDGDGNGYLSDFGIARDTAAAMRQTATGAVAPVSPAYMAPEQLGDGEVSATTDVYSLGILIFEVLTGRHPFTRDSLAQLIRAQLDEPLPPLGDLADGVPNSVDDVIQRATAKQPGARYADVAELVAAFHEAAAGAQETDGLAAPLVVVNPYKGLRAFGEADTADFFGRSSLTAELVEALGSQGAGSRFLAVVGPSGAGKSSVVRAGLVPALRRGALLGSGEWFVAEMIPGPRPFHELETTLVRVATEPPATLLELLTRDEHGIHDAVNRTLPADHELVLVVDQFEEVFTLVGDPDITDRFVAGLVSAATDPRSRLRLVVTLRADFYDRPLAHPALAELMRDRTITVLPLTADELERAVDGPAQRAGVSLEPGLMAEIVADVVGQPGALPLLQYTLTELFEQRRGTTLTMDGYRNLGGVSGAVGRKAQETLEGLVPATQEVARQVMLRLVTLGEGAGDTRRRVMRSELAASGSVAAVDEVLDAFGRQRLLAFDYDAVTHEPTVEVAHEALIREWPQLRSWLDDARDDIRTQRRLALLAAEWDLSGRDDGLLASGTRLRQLETWAAATTVAFSETEDAYLAASVTRRLEQEEAERLREEREEAVERRSRTRLRVLVAVMAIASVIALSLTGYALNQQRRANDQADLAQSEAYRATAAEQQALTEAERADSETDRAHAAEADAEHAARVATARSLVAASANTLDVDPGLALLLALEAADATDPEDEGTLPEASDAVRRANQRAAGLEPIAVLQEEPSNRTPISTNSAMWPRAFSDDGAIVATVDNEGGIHLFESTSGGELPVRFPAFPFDGLSDDPVTLAFSHDGRRLAVSTTLDSSILYAIEGMVLNALPPGNHVSFGADDRLITLASGNQVFVIDGADPDSVVATLCCHRLDVLEARLTPSGERLVALTGFEFTIWEIAGESAIVTAPLGQAGAVSEDGSRVLTSTAENVLQVWNTETGAIEKEFSLEVPPRIATIAANGERIAYTDGVTSAVLDVETGATLLTFAPALKNEVNDDFTFLLTFDPTGSALLVGTSNDFQRVSGTISIWDVDNRSVIRQLPMENEDNVDALLSVGLDRFVTWGSAGPTELWNLLREGPSSDRDWTTALPMPAHDIGLAGDNRGIAATRGEPIGIELTTGATAAASSPPDHIAAVSPDGSHVLGRGPGGVVSVHVTGETAPDWSVAVGEPSALAIDDEGTHLATATGRELTLWDPQGAEPIVVNASSPISALSLSGDGAWLATADNDGFLEVRSTQDLNVVGSFFSTEVGERVVSIALHPAGKTLAAGYNDGTIRLWSVAAGEETILTAHEPHIVTVLAFTDDGRLVSGDASGRVVLWTSDWTQGANFRVLDSVTAVRLAPEADLMLIGSSDGRVRAATTSLDDLLAFAEAHTTRDLSPLECAAFGVEC